MIGDLFDSPWKVLIVAVVLIVLFGSKKLPDAARSLGKSMRILKTEVGSLHQDEATTGAPAKSHSATPGPPAQLTAAPAPGQQTQSDALQQIRDLQRAATVDAPAPAVHASTSSEPQRTQLPS